MPFPLLLVTQGVLLDKLPPISVQQLRLTSKDLWQQIQQFAGILQITAIQDINLLVKHTWPEVTHMKLTGIDVTSKEIRCLAQAQRTCLPALKHFSISRQSTAPDTITQLASGSWTSLVSLDLSSAFAGQALTPSLLQSCRSLAEGSWPQLTALDFSNNFMTAAAMDELTLGDWPMLRSLNISAHEKCFADSFVPALARAPWSSLQTLNLSNIVLADSTKHLQTGHWPNLTKLNLSGCFTPVEKTVIISCQHVAACNWPQLTSLDLSQSWFGSSAAMAGLAQSKWSALKKLKISDSIGCFVAQLASATWTALQELDSSGILLEAIGTQSTAICA